MNLALPGIGWAKRNPGIAQMFTLWLHDVKVTVESYWPDLQFAPLTGAIRSFLEEL